jgi:hypothetical protein
MLHVPTRFATVLVAFAPVFVQARTWKHAQMLVPGQRMVCSILRLIGLRRERHFVTCHRVLNRAVWDSRLAAHLLLGLLMEAFVPTGPVLLGADDSIERRRGKRISAKGIDRDPVGPAVLLRQDQRAVLAQPEAAARPAAANSSRRRCCALIHSETRWYNRLVRAALAG